MESDECRVAVHSGDGQVDLVLPSAVPVGLLLPGLCDIVNDAVGVAVAGPSRLPRQLYVPGLPPLDLSKTLSENGIPDGSTLVLSTSPGIHHEPPALGCAESLARMTTAAAGTWTPDGSRASALMIAVVLAGAAGVLAVPGPPGVPHLLLGASAAGGAAAVAARVATVGRTVFTSQAFGYALIVGAALCVIAAGGGAQHVGLLLAPASIAALVAAGPLTLLMCGVSSSALRDLDPNAHDRPSPPQFAPDCLCALVVAAASTATLGVLLAVGRHPGAPDCALAAVVAVALVLRARAHHAVAPRIALLIGAAASAAIALVAARQLSPDSAPWLCAAVVAAAGATVRVGWRAGHWDPSPSARHIVHLTECGVLAGVIPLACWGFDMYAAVRGWSLP